ncbi:hypothetical protein SUGI_0126830 [Cryptomeria japonica]|nr:hypothetical protein SUGI_0126830 [Cryptomeria japonica]
MCLIPKTPWLCFPPSSAGLYENGRKKVFRALYSHETLPWIEGNGDKSNAMEKHGAKQTGGKKQGTSSWNEAADNYFAKQPKTRYGHSIGNKKSFETNVKKHVEISNEQVVSTHIEETEDEEDSEPVNDERWEKIKKNYRKMMETDERRRPKRSYEEKADERRRPYEEKTVPWDHREGWGKKTWREVSTASTLPKIVGEAVYGVGPVLAAITIARRELYALYVQEGLDLSSTHQKKKDKASVEKILQIAGKLGLSVKEASKHDLNMLVDSRPHQGLVLDASPLEMESITELDSVSDYEGKGSSPLWVALDEVTDPQNFGAVVRSAYFFGATGVVVCAKNSAPLSGVVSKASAGSLELTELRTCRNMMKFLELSASNGWRVLGASVSQEAVSLNEVSPGVPTILVLGSEGRGLRPLVRRSCSQLISIPGTLSHNTTRSVDDSSIEDQFELEEFNQFMAVESLNVSVAAGILLYHLIRSPKPSLDSKSCIQLESQ